MRPLGENLLSMSYSQPEQVSRFLCNLTVLSAVTTGIAADAIYYNRSRVEDSLVVLIIFMLMILGTQFLSFVFFGSKKRALKYPKSHMIIACMMCVKSMFDLYFFYYVVNVIKELPQVNLVIGFLVLLIGFLYQIIKLIYFLYENKLYVDQEKRISLNNRINKFKLKPSTYLLCFLLVWSISQYNNYFEDQFSLIILFLAFTFQISSYATWPIMLTVSYMNFGKNSVSGVNHFSQMEQHVTYKFKNAKWGHVLLIKPIQYLLLFFLVPLFIDVDLESIDMLKTIFLIVCLFMLLKWISQYSISPIGLYYINGLLSALIFSSMMMITWFLSNSGPIKTPAMLLFFIMAMIPVAWLWHFNVILFLRKT